MTSAKPRLAKFAVANLDPGQRALYDDIVGGPRSTGPQAFPLTDCDGGLEGPFNAMLLSPALGAKLQALGAALRFETDFTAREREIAILLIATAWNSAFERYAHEAIGRRVGLTEIELAGLRDGASRCLSNHRERLLADTCTRMAEDGSLDDNDFTAALAEFGAPMLFQLATLVGYYATLALQLRVFDVAVPDR